MSAPLIAETRRRAIALLRHPARAVALAFAAATLLGTFLLTMPIASASGAATDPFTALFTAVSAVCVTGLVVVDTAGHWSTFGEVVILGLIQVGGFGIMTLASLLILLVSRRIGLRMQMTAQAETKALGLGEVRKVLLGVIITSLLVEAVIAVFLIARFATGYDKSFGQAVYHGVFHAVSAFNNAGFALYPDSIVRFATDPFICVPLMIATITGGLGFPVLLELARRRKRRGKRWSLHTKITIPVYFGLLVFGAGAFLAFEWGNPTTLGPMGTLDKILIGFFHSVQPRTAGFNSIDMAQVHPSTLLLNDVLMFIGGGSAGTAGGIKVTTFALLGWVMLAEIRGEPTVHIMGRKLAGEVQRQALTVALLGVGAVMAGTIVLLSITPFRLDDVLFEATSAFATVGMSTGITAQLPVAGQVVLVVLMFMGRLGPITLASALALRERARRYELPEERPIVG
ncbi:potassium uptake protein, TrkH family [Actinokineospora alba]|uniref:Potassium uptake protein, TrkH family n=1 Tax=Actinokineospora alba TaxID=504798 RepID=A0A1H0TTU1_9PSEU|nr:potassium transporter TrkG [Actinokineospora alba]TDP70695.1 potassium uptake TrkH family protein [Actinokineospora alba]SDJ13966.1 potassium uptake protein, TrkH family [Actinokineospora alba]SDP57058.1 potassium uptake protein, TrkH family [Actinokineospora alba]